MKGLPCMWRECKKVLSSKDALNQHVLSHRDEKLKCDLCLDDGTDQKTYPTIMSLKEHKQGSHGKGYIAYCGKVCKWPSKCRKHQAECKLCGDMKLKKLNKEENPHKLKA